MLYRQLNEPLKLTTHGYNNPYEALRDKAQSILTQIVAHRKFSFDCMTRQALIASGALVDYSSMVKQRSLGPDNLRGSEDDDITAAFLDALRTRAMDDLLLAAQEYGITLKDLGKPNFVSPCHGN